MTTFLIAYLVTGNIIVSALIGGLEGTTKMVIYYGHERVWSRQRWGLVPDRNIETHVKR